jgi:hypothetical protein
MSQPVYCGTLTCTAVRPAATNPAWFYADYSIAEIRMRLENVLIRHIWRGTSTYVIERPACINFETRNEADTFWDEALTRALDTGLLVTPQDQGQLFDFEQRRYPD